MVSVSTVRPAWVLGWLRPCQRRSCKMLLAYWRLQSSQVGEESAKGRPGVVRAVRTD